MNFEKPSLDIALLGVVIVLSIVTVLLVWLCHRCETGRELRNCCRRQPKTRGDLEQGVVWKCSICDFTNDRNIELCVLCSTSKGYYAEQSSPTSNKGKPNHLSLDIKMLNAKQRLARNRLDWVWKVSETESNEGNVPIQGYWEATSSNNKEGFILSIVDASMQPRLTFMNHLDKTKYPPSMIKNVEEYYKGVASKTFSVKYRLFMKETSKLTTTVVQPQMSLVFPVNRSSLFFDSLEILSTIDPMMLHDQWRIEFVGESVVDAGGLQREWYSLLWRAIFDENNGLFQPSNDGNGSYCIHRNNSQNDAKKLHQYHGVGRLLGRTLMEGEMLPTKLSLNLLKFIIGSPITFDDLQFIDPSLYHNIVCIKTTKDVEKLSLDFSVMEQDETNTMQIIDLKPNGRNILVDDNNKEEYIHLLFRYIVFGKNSKQLYSLLRGLFEIIPQELLCVFDFKELEFMLCGHQLIDVKEWKKYSVSFNNFKTYPILKWFWEIVQSMDNEQRSRLLQFSTGSALVPLQGFQALTSYDGRLCPFTIMVIAYPIHAYPQSETCFNRLKLPNYPRKDLLAEAIHLLISIDFTGFVNEY